MMTIGVDIGGTNIRGGLIANGNIIKETRIKLKNKDSLNGTLGQLMEVLAPLITPEVAGIGIGVPSVVDVDEGIVYDVANIPAWKRVELKKFLEEHFGIPVFVNNDVNCFVMGEHTYGEAKGLGSLVGVTLGTGMGAGIIFNHQLCNGFNCGAGEVGLIPYLDKTLEAYVGSLFFTTQYNKSAEEIWLDALQDEKEALMVWEEFGKHIAQAVKILLYAYDPEAIVLGGSIAKGFSFFEKSMWQCLQDFEYPNSLKRLKILVSKQESIALLGAASLANLKNS
ncbi:glucokinase [bacterium A37T11]|nr:glucokinase [bacterium A37T11]